MGEPTFVEALEKLGRKTVIIAGIEAHVCVQQTVIDLLDKGYKVFIANDCIASRSNNDKKYAQRRMGDAGAVGTTYESICLNCLRELRNQASSKSLRW
jgi:nicotinamidase-related amidase